MTRRAWPRSSTACASRAGHAFAASRPIVKTSAGAEAGFAHSLANQANPAATRATPLVRPPLRHKVTAPASIRDHPAAHINANVTGEEAAREKERREPAEQAVPRPTITPTARTQRRTI